MSLIELRTLTSNITNLINEKHANKLHVFAQDEVKTLSAVIPVSPPDYPMDICISLSIPFFQIKDEASFEAQIIMNFRSGDISLPSEIYTIYRNRIYAHNKTIDLKDPEMEGTLHLLTDLHNLVKNADTPTISHTKNCHNPILIQRDLNC